MPKTILISTLALVLATPALAQSELSHLRDALASAPEFLLTNPDPFHFHFLDVKAWRAATADLEPALAPARINFADMIGAVATLRMAPPEQWQERAATSLDDIAWIAGFGPAQHAIAYWGFKTPDAVTALVDALQTRDFEFVGESDILGNGEPQAMNFDKSDPADPWRGGVGQASFIQPQGALLLQSTFVPEAIEELWPVEASLADHAIPATALTGLEAVLPAEAALVQAMMVSPAFGLEAFDPVDIISLSGSLEETRANIEAAMATAGQGIPPYFGGLLADIEVKGRSGFAVSLTYPDCDTAGQAVAGILASWNASLDPELPAEKSELTVEGTDGLCSAALVFTSSDAATNLSGQIYNRILRRDFPLLQIGTAS